MDYLKSREELINHKKYLSWKRKNVSLRGVNETGVENGGLARFGSGLYTAALSNRSMIKDYPIIMYVINAIPKKAKIVNTTGNAEMFLQNVINNWCKDNNIEYNANYFSKKTSVKEQMLKLGYDGLIIKGREYVNYTPEDIKYFNNELALLKYFNRKINL